MDIYRQFARRIAGVRTPYNPTGVTVSTFTLAGVAIEAGLAAVNAGAVGRFRASTTDALYTQGTVYQARWRKTANGYTWNKTTVYEHVDPSATAIPGAPTVGLYSYTDTTATFSNVLGTDATSTLITLVPSGGGAAITASGSGAFITVTGLSPSTVYDWGAEGVNGSITSGIDTPNLGRLTTERGSTIDKPLLVKVFLNGEDTYAARREIDIKQEKGGFTVGDDRRPLGQGPNALVVIENNYGNWWGMMDATIRYREPEQAPFGLGSRSRAR